MKKITHLINGLDSGGAESVLIRLIIQDKLNEHFVISLKDDGFYGQVLDRNNVKFEKLQLDKFYNILFGIGLFKLIYLLIKFKPNTLVTWMPHSCLLGGLTGKILGIKNIIWNFRGASENINDNTLLHRIILMSCKFFQDLLPSKVVVCANYINIIFSEYGFNTSSFTTIYNGYDTDYFSRCLKARKKFRSEFFINEDIPLIGMIARWHPQKNHNLLIESLKRVKSKNMIFKCLLLGEGIKNESLIKKIERSGLTENIILRGETSEISEIMSALDIHILTSRFGEGFPNVIAEAMSCGVPCIATDVGDSRYIIGNTGWIIESNSIPAMSEKIISVIEHWKDKKDWSERSFQARKRIIENFQISQMVEKYQNLY